MQSLSPFNLSAWIFISIYLLSLLLIGWAGYKARRENTLSDFYLAGSGFGFFVLFLTLYATQYSGNTLFGYTGKTYRIGFAWIMCVQFMMAIIVCYLLYAPKLHYLAKQKGFITPTDYLKYRFNSKSLNLITSLVMIVVLGNYFLAQLMAMGRAMQGLSSGDPLLAYIFGVILLTAIMVVYGTLGGLRAIAWTDAIQGIVLMIGFGLLLFVLNQQYGSVELASITIQSSTDLAVKNKTYPPDADRIREWISYILLVGLAGSLYPQAIQRIYAARNAKILRKSLAVMVFIPLTTTLVAVVTGVYAIAYMPGLEGASSDQIFARILFEVQQGSLFGYWLVVILFSAALAAMMSTADSALLSISSMFSQDIYGGFINQNASQAELTRVGKLCSWVIVFVLIGLAIYLYDKASLIRLLDRKFDLLIQLVPAFIMAIHIKQIKTGPVIIGLVTGILISVLIAFGGFDQVQSGKLFGFHPGLYGLLINITIVVSGSLIIKTRK